MSAVEPKAFTVYPAIDVRGGHVVRLTQGDYGREQRYGDDPLAVARDYAEAGAEWLHLVDLDAARDGAYSLHSLVSRIQAETGLRVQTGGGVRRACDVEALLAAGADRVVVGTLSVTQPRTVVEWLGRFGAERICVAMDVRKDPSGRWCAATQGWTEMHQAEALPAIGELTESGLKHILSTDIDRDGMLGGPALDWYGTLARQLPALQVQGSGGVAALEDVRALRAGGCCGAIIGRALLEGRFGLAEALRC